jgi:hypothetical protein
VGDTYFDSELRRRQRLPEHLAAEYLRAADVPAVTAEDVVLDTLELEQMDQVGEYKMHVVASAVMASSRESPHCLG